MTPTRYWLGVVSRDHVRIGVQEGIAQLNHGKRHGLDRMKQGDWLIYYSPRTSYPDGAPLQAFTAIGRITTKTPYQITLESGFQPFRHDVAWRICREVTLATATERLPGIAQWKGQLRFGQVELPGDHFLMIATLMGVDPASTEEDA